MENVVEQRMEQVLVPSLAASGVRSVVHGTDLAEGYTAVVNDPNLDSALCYLQLLVELIGNTKNQV